MTSRKTVRLAYAELTCIDAALSAERQRCEQLLASFPDFWQPLLDQACSAQRAIRKALYPNLAAEDIAQSDKRIRELASDPAGIPAKAT